MLKSSSTSKVILPTTTTGSLPRPSWFNQNLGRRDFKQALGDAVYREQYIDAVSSVIRDQELVGLDIVTDGNMRYDLEVGGKSWFFYPLYRIKGFKGGRDTSPYWTKGLPIYPGHILWEVMESYQAPIVKGKVEEDIPLRFATIWKTAQNLTKKPVKFSSISSQVLIHMTWNEYYKKDEDYMMDLAKIFNREHRELVASGCNIIQVDEPVLHFTALDPQVKTEDLRFQVNQFNSEVEGVNAEIWAHTCWGNPAQQCVLPERPSYQKSFPHILDLDADVITFEMASTNGKDLNLLKEYPTDKKIAIGVVSHTSTQVETPEQVANLIRQALKYVDEEKLILTSDCGYGREGLSRRIAFYKSKSTVDGANIVRKELNAPVAAA